MASVQSYPAGSAYTNQSVAAAPMGYSESAHTTTYQQGPTTYQQGPTTTTTSYQQGPTTYQQGPTTTTYQQGASSTTTYQQGPVTTTSSYQSGGGALSQQGSTIQYSSPGAASTQYAQYSTHAEIPTGSRMITGQERVQTQRKVSSTVVNEQFLGPAPQDYPVREVEVPGPIQEVIKHVPRKEVVETEKRVPRYEYEWVERIVEVPRIEYVDRTVEVPQYQEVIREVRVPQVIDVPKEVIREVKVPKINYVEQIKEVPGEIIEVPKPYTVEQKVELTRYQDRQHPVVVAQTVKPYIVEGSGNFEVDVYEYEPECVPVDVHVIKAVQARVQAGGVVETSHKVISVPAAQYNTILQQLNVHLGQQESQKLPYLTENGHVSFLGERVVYCEPQPGANIAGLDTSNLVRTHVDQSSRKVLPVNDPMLIAGRAGTSYAQHQGSYGQSYLGGQTQTTTTYTTTTGPANYGYGATGGSAFSQLSGGAQMLGTTYSAAPMSTTPSMHIGTR